ncbi:MAG TPA: tol-pal system-associated acyl-CoA thioesterase [Steroidobacteraceae bacterium]|nr:tol-pal system-associated acyl-CoA thioesterase [Steroidobacteraceae bacterium]
MTPFVLAARVYWEDTDGGGVVYHANYLKFLERARTEWLRARGFSQQGLAREHGILFAVTRMEIAFRAPARLDDELTITCEVKRAGAASLSFAQRVLRARAAALAAAPAAGETAENLLASATVRIACVDAHTFRPQRLPQWLDVPGTDEEPA